MTKILEVTTKWPGASRSFPPGTYTVGGEISRTEAKCCVADGAGRIVEAEGKAADFRSKGAAPEDKQRGNAPENKTGVGTPNGGGRGAGTKPGKPGASAGGGKGSRGQ